jgi:hypothetical protein
VDHPTALACAILTIQAAQKSSDFDDRLAASTSDVMARVAQSREASARSRAILAKLKARDERASGSGGGSKPLV